MKKLFISILVLFILCVNIITNVTAQKILQFNDVKLVTSTETVPQGRVWKIENILPNTRLSSAAAIVTDSQTIETETTSTQQIIKINNNDIYIASSDAKSRAVKHYYINSSAGASASASASAYGISGPIWLPEGTTLAASTGVYAISVIEFIVTNP
ncbi:MAG TPA: hypothetical protein P5250_03015 [Bacteroidales bacterium]|nr:hypothetical protein [Bacteroidales bacterium]